MRFIDISALDRSLFINSGNKPVLKPDEVLVKVVAFGINRADLLQVQGKYPPPPGASEILGLECSGIIVALGSNVTQWSLGTPVFGLVDGGAYAEYCAMHVGMIWEKPNHLSFEQAAAIPESYLTAFQTIHYLVGSSVSDPSTWLLHAAASSVSQAIIQLLRIKGKVEIWGTCSQNKMDFVTQLGVHHVIDYQSKDFVEKISKTRNEGGVDVVVDYIGADYWTKNLKVLLPDGVLVMLGFLSGVKVDQINLFPIIQKRLKIQGSTLRARSKDYKAKLCSDFYKEYKTALTSGAIQPYVDQVFNWENIHEAHTRMEANQNKGKMVVRIPSE